MLIDMEILSYLDSEFISNFTNLDNLNQNFEEEKVKQISQKLLKLLSYQAKLENKFSELTMVEESKLVINVALEQQQEEKQSFDQEFSEEIDANELARLEKEKKEREEKREKDANFISKQLSQNL